ncbi:MAG: ASKHA domain-containing protein [Candidatus Thorarchaeota archaeon]
MDRFRIIIEPSGQRVLAIADTTYLDAIRKSGLYISSECGGKGTCGKCRVHIEPVPRITQEEERILPLDEKDQGIRLACRHLAERDTRIVVLGVGSDPKILSESRSAEEYLISDQTREGKYGIAIDLGTTTIVTYLMDLFTGLQMHQISELNPQVLYGEDIITRLAFASTKEDNRYRLQKVVIECIEKMVGELCIDQGIRMPDIKDISVVGNTVMHHLLLGLDISRLGVAPYAPESLEKQNVVSSRIGFRKIRSKMYFGPLIGGYVGSDITALILAERLHAAKDIVIAIDIGTNGEVVLSNRGDLFVCSTAAGSAFEGAVITHGMRGQLGAIEHVSIASREDQPVISVIGSEIPRGLCGSGIVDLVAELLKVGIISRNGRLSESSRTTQDSVSGLSYIVVDSSKYGKIIFSQRDIRQVQTAKAAILSGVKILLDMNGIRIDEIDRVLLAGAFGNYINPLAALRIGLIPEVPIEAVFQVGNTAGLGAKMMLLSSEMRHLSEKVVKGITHVELVDRREFEKVFIESTWFPV